MKKKIVMGLLASTVLASPLLAEVSPASGPFIPVGQNEQWKQSLNGDWKFKYNEKAGASAKDFFALSFNDASWDTIPVPSNYELHGHGKLSYGNNFKAEGLYRRTFDVPRAWKGRKAMIQFDGVHRGLEFWVNGKRIGKFDGAFNRSHFDVSSALEYGKKNLIAVRAYRDFGDSSRTFDSFDGWDLGGMHRDVTLFSVPAKDYVQDLTLVTTLERDLTQGGIECTVKGIGNTLHAKLSDPSGKKIAQLSGSLKSGEAKLVFEVNDPLLWNAETPHLYTVEFALANAAGKRVYSFTRRIGIRVVNNENGVLTLNYQPIKMRGVNHHDIHPDTGRAMTEAQYREDIELMKKGNINSVRMSHYPPNKIFMDLCDEYGFYVVNEIPINAGHAKGPYEAIQARANSTIYRDKNHTCTLIWTVGNENKINDNLRNATVYVAEMDPTRFRTINWVVKGPKGANILTTHYPNHTDDLDWTNHEKDTEGNPIPVVFTEYAHSLGRCFEWFKVRWEHIERTPGCGGGYIWLFQDQAVKSKGEYQGDNRETVWLDKETYLNTHGAYGTDGLVYGDRIPQVEYFVMRNVYAQVQLTDESKTIRSGQQDLTFEVLNRYDFINLDQIQCAWDYLVDGTVVESGTLALAAPPHGKTQASVSITVPADYQIRENLLAFRFVDQTGRPVNEQVVALLDPSGKRDLESRLATLGTSPVEVTGQGALVRIKTETTLLQLDNKTGKVIISGSDSKSLAGPIIRVGRKPTIVEYRNYVKKDLPFWLATELDNGTLLSSKVVKNEDGSVSLQTKLSYVRTETKEQVDTYLGRGRRDGGGKNVEKVKQQKREANGGIIYPDQTIEAEITYTVSPQGIVNVDYALTPQNADGYMLEFGLGFETPEKVNTLKWLGNGPYWSYPGQGEGIPRGIWTVSTTPLTDPLGRFFYGPRVHVDFSAMVTPDQNGFGFLHSDSTINIDEHNGNLLYVHVHRTAGLGNKNKVEITEELIKVEELGTVEGQLRIVPLQAGKWPELFQTILGQAQGLSVDTFNKK